MNALEPGEVLKHVELIETGPLVEAISWTKALGDLFGGRFKGLD